MSERIKIVILAAGKGKRMGDAKLPKVLQPFLGKPMISRLLASVQESKIDPKPVIVVGFQAEMVKQALGASYIYVEQKELLGTGHAVKQTQGILENQADHIMVLLGDYPCISPAFIKNLAATHTKTKSILTLATATVPDFEGWKASFKDFARIVRDEKKHVIHSVESRDATPEQLRIHEVNVGLYCFQAQWLWPHLNLLKNENSQKEYYLPDLIQMAIEEKQPIATTTISPKECIGINSKEQLALAEQLYAKP